MYFRTSVFALCPSSGAVCLSCHRQGWSICLPVKKLISRPIAAIAVNNIADLARIPTNHPNHCDGCWRRWWWCVASFAIARQKAALRLRAAALKEADPSYGDSDAEGCQSQYLMRRCVDDAIVVDRNIWDGRFWWIHRFATLDNFYWFRFMFYVTRYILQLTAMGRAKTDPKKRGRQTCVVAFLLP